VFSFTLRWLYNQEEAKYTFIGYEPQWDSVPFGTLSGRSCFIRAVNRTRIACRPGRNRAALMPCIAV
jgi:hypothetical protein